MRAAIVGRSGLGGVNMRGKDVADRLGIAFLDLRSTNWAAQTWDTLLVVKYWDDRAPLIRSACERLIHDPLDCFTQTKPNAEPAAYWKWCVKQTGADVLIGTSPACVESMIPAGLPVWLMPHHADPRIGRNWHDPRGPVVYAGGVRFLGNQIEGITLACERLGKAFQIVTDKHCWRALEGAAVTLSVRIGAEATQLNRVCKPQVKLANAAKAGIPAVSTPDPAVTSLCGCALYEGDWCESIADAMRCEMVPTIRETDWSFDAYCHELARLLEL